MFYVTNYYLHLFRNEEHAELLEPRSAKIPILGLGSSVSTPAEGKEM